MKNVMIPYDLFYSMIRYHLFNDLSCEDTIRKGLEEKINALADHELFTKSKMASTEEEREKARSKYLDRRGIRQDFRW